MTSLRVAALAVVAPLVVAAAGCSRGASDVAGTWDTIYNGAQGGDATLTLTGSGSKVNGTYTGQHSGTLEGTIKSSVLTGRWKEGDEPKKQGTFTFTFKSDGKSFKGLFQSDDGSTGGSWDGRRH